MNLKDIRAPKGANKERKRLGRGQGSGLGKTAGKGHKGQHARGTGKLMAGFEGGQMPLRRRLPKFGFTNIFRLIYSEVKLSDLERLSVNVIDDEVLEEAGLLRSGTCGVKILGNGDITRAVTVRVNKITDGARQKIEAAGGKVELIEVKGRPVDVDVAHAVKLAADVIDFDAIVKGKLVPEGTTDIRLIKRGNLKIAKTFRVANISRTARRAILAVGGKIEEIG